jgi:hypothetical protein
MNEPITSETRFISPADGAVFLIVRFRLKRGRISFQYHEQAEVPSSFIKRPKRLKKGSGTYNNPVNKAFCAALTDYIRKPPDL